MSTYNYNRGTTKRLSLKFTKLSIIQTQPQTLDTEVGRLQYILQKDKSSLN